MPTSIPAASERLASHRRNQLGLGLLLVSLSVGFIGMFVLYGVLRHDMGRWPPAGQPSFPLLWPSVNTVVVIISSWTMHKAVMAVRQARPRSFARWVLLTTNFGLAFLVVQVLSGSQALSIGIQVGGTYGSLLFLLVAFHAAHLVVGVVALGVMSALATSQDYTPARLGAVITWSRYWHFVSVAWLFMYVLLFLL